MGNGYNIYSEKTFKWVVSGFGLSTCRLSERDKNIENVVQAINFLFQIFIEFFFFCNKSIESTN